MRRRAARNSALLAGGACFCARSRPMRSLHVGPGGTGGSRGAAPARALDLQRERASPFDLALSGPSPASRRASPRYARWSDLRALPTAELTLDGEFVKGPQVLTVLFLADLLGRCPSRRARTRSWRGVPTGTRRSSPRASSPRTGPSSCSRSTEGGRGLAPAGPVIQPGPVRRHRLGGPRAGGRAVTGPRAQEALGRHGSRAGVLRRAVQRLLGRLGLPVPRRPGRPRDLGELLRELPPGPRDLRGHQGGPALPGRSPRTPATTGPSLSST